jgi:endonuclease/exonuclease/phosphatase family metal-dependent hydrolase
MDVETKLGTVHIINTHLSLGWRERLLQIQLFTSAEWHAAIVGDVPVFLLGDFTTLPGSRAYRALTCHLRDVRELVRATRPSRTFTTWFPVLVVDDIFVNAALQPLSLTGHRSAVARIASEHFPLVAELAPASSHSAR